MPAYLIVIIAASLVLAGIAVRFIWTARRTRGEHSHYHPAFSVSAVATRIVREAARDQTRR